MHTVPGLDEAPPLPTVDGLMAGTRALPGRPERPASEAVQ